MVIEATPVVLVELSMSPADDALRRWAMTPWTGFSIDEYRYG
jgi:hypothetical protein